MLAEHQSLLALGAELVLITGNASNGYRVTNVGFVPLCVTGFRLEGADCADFVLLDTAVKPAGLRAGEAGLMLNWRAGPSGYDLAGGTFASSGPKLAKSPPPPAMTINRALPAGPEI